MTPQELIERWNAEALALDSPVLLIPHGLTPNAAGKYEHKFDTNTSITIGVAPSGEFGTALLILQLNADDPAEVRRVPDVASYLLVVATLPERNQDAHVDVLREFRLGDYDVRSVLTHKGQLSRGNITYFLNPAQLAPDVALVQFAATQQ